MENPAEETVRDLQEGLNEKATEVGDSLLTKIALTTALIAAFAAVTGYLAGERADEALVDQIHAADHWSYYQAKSIKSAVLSAKMDLLREQSGKPASKTDEMNLARYDREMEEIKVMAEEKQKASSHRLEQRMILANGVTLFQIAIAIGAISAITRKKMLWGVSLIFGLGGLVQLLHEILFL